MGREWPGGHVKPKKRFQWEEKGQLRGKARDTSGSGSLKDARGTVSWRRSSWGFLVIRVTGGLRGESWDSEIKVKRTVSIIAFGQDLGQVHAGLEDNKVLKSKLEVFT